MEKVEVFCPKFLNIIIKAFITLYCLLFERLYRRDEIWKSLFQKELVGGFPMPPKITQPPQKT